MNILQRNNVQTVGDPTAPVLLYGHGFGCDQTMWSSITPAFEQSHFQVLFDYVGSGKSDISAYNVKRYATLQGYAQDIIEICTALGLTKNVVFNGFKELKKVWASLQNIVPLKRYLGGFFVSSMAVQTVMLVATYFGAQEIEWATKEDSTIGLIKCILIIQLVAVVGAVLTSRASAKFGNIPTLIVINSIWAIFCALAYFIVLPMHFYVMATVAGFVMGGIQALSRSTYSKLLPETEDTASFFSFYDVAEKIGIVIGMCVYGIIDQITGSPRAAIVILGIFFVTAIFLLRRVHKKDVSN